MKKIIIFAALTLFIFSCHLKKNDYRQAPSPDSIRIADSLTTLQPENKHVKITNNGDIQTSRGYSSDPNYKPTISSQGQYHTIDGKARQIQFQGSLEQKEQLEMLDEYERTHPGY